MIIVKVREYGNRETKSKEFGYTVRNDVQGYRHLDYQNRARLMSGQYLLEEKNWPNQSISFNQITIVKDQKEADEILYKRANQAAKKALENLIPVLINETQMSQKLREKKSEQNKKQKKQKYKGK